MSSELPPDGPPPPTYEQATGSSQASSSRQPQHLHVPSRGESSNAVPLSARRSMEDEARPLPKGWVRQFDAEHEHQFFVDTTAKPPRSIWHHPYDDDEYLATLTSEERETLQEQSRKAQAMDAESIDDETPTSPPPRDSGKQSASKPAGAGAEGSSSRKSSSQGKLGRRLKDKLTGTTHEQRVAQRAQREKEEYEAYQRHLKVRSALSRAVATGEPQLLGQDKDGKDVYIEPPDQPAGYGYPPRSRAVNPYTSGVYANPNARFIRPPAPYSRPGYGYGSPYGGYGYGPYGGYGGLGGGGLALGAGAGLLGGALLGGLLF